MTSSQDPRLRLVLFGEQRSGTTLLCDLLDAQLGVRVAASYLGGMMYCAFRELALSPPHRLSPRQRRVLWQRTRISERQRDVYIEPEMPSAVQTLDQLHAYLLGLIASPSDRIVGHKIHGPIEALPALLDIPDVRCIYLIRDVRDVLLSRSYRGDSFFDEPAAMWLESARVARENTNNERLFVMRFEDLIGNPRSVLERLGRWLGITIMTTRAQLDADGRPELQNSSFGDLTSAFDRTAVERFRSHRHSRLVRFAQWRCRKELRAWSYRLEPEMEPAISERLEFMQRVLVTQALAMPRSVKNALLARTLPSLVRDE